MQSGGPNYLLGGPNYLLGQLLEWRPKHDNDESYNTRRAYWLETDVNKDGYMSRQELEATLPHRARLSPRHGAHREGRPTRARVHTSTPRMTFGSKQSTVTQH